MDEKRETPYRCALECWHPDALLLGLFVGAAVGALVHQLPEGVLDDGHLQQGQEVGVFSQDRASHALLRANSTATQRQAALERALRHWDESKEARACVARTSLQADVQH